MSEDQGTGRSAKATALVLAGQRDGRMNPLAVAAGVSHKCLVPAAGEPLIAHVLRALSASDAIDDILVSVDAGVLDAVPEAMALIEAGRLHVVPPQPGIAESVEAAAVRAPSWPLIITTGDNILLRPEAVNAVFESVTAPGTDAVAGLTTRSAVLAAHPEGQRRFYELADEGYANCNLYALASPRVLRAASIFREGGQFAKNPGRLLRAFGLMNVIRFRLGRTSLQKMFAHLSRRFGLSMRPLVFNDGSLAIDVDNERTYAIAESLLKGRQAH